VRPEAFAKLTEHYTMKTYGGVDIYSYMQVYFTSTKLEVSGQFSALAALVPVKELRNPLDWRWVDLRAALEDMGKYKFLTLPGLEIQPLGHPARSQSPYRLRYRVYQPPVDI
jgi:hypothetical protein